MRPDLPQRRHFRYRSSAVPLDQARWRVEESTPASMLLEVEVARVAVAVVVEPV